MKLPGDPDAEEATWPGPRPLISIGHRLQDCVVENLHRAWGLGQDGGVDFKIRSGYVQLRPHAVACVGVEDCLAQRCKGTIGCEVEWVGAKLQINNTSLTVTVSIAAARRSALENQAAAYHKQAEPALTWTGLHRGRLP